MPISPDFTSVLEETFEISFLHCYPNAYLKYTDLCNLLQLTAGSHADKGGISYSDLQLKQQAWVLSRMRVEISKLPKWRDVVTVKTWIKSLENSRSVRCLEMHLNGEKIVGCETFWAVINTETRRPDALATPHDHFEKYDISATEKPTEKISIPKESTVCMSYEVTLSDIDIVNHVNNVKYLEWCLDAEDPEKLLQRKIATLDINFMRELNLKDKANICCAATETESVYSITKEGKNVYALQIGWKP